MTFAGRLAPTLAELQSCFDMPIAEACARLGMGQTALKSACRALGIRRWPHMSFRSLEAVRGLLTAEQYGALRMWLMLLPGARPLPWRLKGRAEPSIDVPSVRRIVAECRSASRSEHHALYHEWRSAAM